MTKNWFDNFMENRFLAAMVQKNSIIPFFPHFGAEGQNEPGTKDLRSLNIVHDN
jgi:hypothetical protein